MECRNTHGIVSALLGELCGLEGQGTFECVESKAIAHSIDVFAKEASKLPDCGKRWPRSSWKMRKKMDKGKKGRVRGMGFV